MSYPDAGSVRRPRRNASAHVSATFNRQEPPGIRTVIASWDRRAKLCDPVQAENYRRRSEHAEQSKPIVTYQRL